ncbi:6,7-dimethyl-8-ribityllumazine synthase [Desulfobacca acetoxidans]|uniref:6,7-dimethyl-8-ribityllumazine synthase n=1 Tax=Desulfobacca acetoxidans (strain ATCC 700848 / DSM 11109 / ASRB2) TaxID=880072 RepID=F2NDT1_DESAR|nr:6,7-dimethyl-8-ribityllumazine synthase [Desulfobacca acetoxidans]AEB10428.1 6,7-dimethyl-8-ribityllumazine synthase [Desulfobacca acetoxidans DSM 11109]HAY21141.1 6,7-dimethyl-8-ribityllumazine synthase [Desulfobacterales bacterium]
MIKTVEGNLLAEGMKFALVVSRFNDIFVERLLGGAVDSLIRRGAQEEDLVVYKVPGAFEIPLVAKRLAQSKKFDAVICLGAVIRGSTPHFDYVAAEVSKGIASVSLDTGVPVLFGIITTDTLDQAIERSGSKAGNKGFAAAEAAVEMVHLLRQIGA